MPLHGSKTGRVLERRRSERVDSVLDDAEVDRVFTRRVDARAGLWVPLLVAGPPDRRDLGLRQALGSGRPLHGRRRAPGRDLRHPRRGRGRALGSAWSGTRCAGSLRPRSSSAGASRASYTTRPARRLTSILLGLKQLDGAGGARGGGRAARAGGGDAAGRAPARGRAAAQGARRLRSRAGARAADAGLRRADRHRRRPRGQRDHRAPAARGRDGDLPDRPGGAHERGQARACTAGQRARHARRWQDPGRARGRRHAASTRPSCGEGIGLVGMRERIELLDGTFTVESSETSGTTLAAEVPA